MLQTGVAELWDWCSYALIQTIDKTINVLWNTVRPLLSHSSELEQKVCYRASYCSYWFEGLAPYDQLRFAIPWLECRYEASRLRLAENDCRRQHRFYLLNNSWCGRPNRISTLKSYALLRIASAREASFSPFKLCSAKPRVTHGRTRSVASSVCKGAMIEVSRAWPNWQLHHFGQIELIHQFIGNARRVLRTEISPHVGDERHAGEDVFRRLSE